MYRPTNWDKVIDEAILQVKAETENLLPEKFDFSVTLPPLLRERVREIMGYDYDEFDEKAFVFEPEEVPDLKSELHEDSEDTEMRLKRRRREKETPFNESTCSEIERMERELHKFELKIHLPIERKRLKTERHHWLSTYGTQKRKKRVKWDSKIYNLHLSRSEMSLDEQAAELMEESAERFIDWFNNLSLNCVTDLSMERIHALFNIEGDKCLLRSVCTEPKEVKAIAKTVADKWNIPKMALELKYEHYIQKRLKEAPKKKNIVKVAFGRTVPASKIPWQPTSAHDRLIKTIFPKELLSGEKLFKGIGHLRTTHKLIAFLKEHPLFEKPVYMMERDNFTEEKTTYVDPNYVPLYERLKLAY